MPSLVFFFFQAEDGIRDYKVTGVQTCALPIYAIADSGRHPPIAIRAARVAKGGVRSNPRIAADHSASENLPDIRRWYTIPRPLKTHIAWVDVPKFLTVWNQKGVAKSA